MRNIKIRTGPLGPQQGVKIYQKHVHLCEQREMRLLAGTETNSAQQHRRDTQAGTVSTFLCLKVKY